MTKLDMWSNMLELHDIKMLSSGCGMTSSGDVTLEIFYLKNIMKMTVYEQECMNGQGKGNFDVIPYVTNVN